jgi:hypothetical protein
MYDGNTSFAIAAPPVIWIYDRLKIRLCKRHEEGRRDDKIFHEYPEFLTAIDRRKTKQRRSKGSVKTRKISLTLSSMASNFITRNGRSQPLPEVVSWLVFDNNLKVPGIRSAAEVLTVTQAHGTIPEGSGLREFGRLNTNTPTRGTQIRTPMAGIPS